VSKKIYFWNLIPLILCLVHLSYSLPEHFGGTIFNMFSHLKWIFFIVGGLYYFIINYRFFKNSLQKAFLFSVIGLSLWWGIDIVLYFTVGNADDVGTFLMKWIAVYNYLLLLITWAITGVIYMVKKKRIK